MDTNAPRVRRLLIAALATAIALAALAAPSVAAKRHRLPVALWYTAKVDFTGTYFDKFDWTSQIGGYQSGWTDDEAMSWNVHSSGAFLARRAGRTLSFSADVDGKVTSYAYRSERRSHDCSPLTYTGRLGSGRGVLVGTVGTPDSAAGTDMFLSVDPGPVAHLSISGMTCTDQLGNKSPEERSVSCCPLAAGGSVSGGELLGLQEVIGLHAETQVQRRQLMHFTINPQAFGHRIRRRFTRRDARAGGGGPEVTQVTRLAHAYTITLTPCPGAGRRPC